VEAVFRSHGGLVWRAVLAMSAGNRDVADEATSEAFAQLLAYRDGVRDPVAWVFHTAFRLAGRDLKGRRLEIGHPAPDAPSAAPPALPADVVAGLRRLSPEQRTAVFLHYFADLPVAEVARLSGVATATVRVRLHRARRALAASLDLAGRGNA
jgi:DNA-directed RNA polymerase specialized sigma24 family protein